MATNTLTNAQRATIELARRKYNRTHPGEYTPTTDKDMLTKRKAELQSFVEAVATKPKARLASHLKPEGTKVAKTVKVKIAKSVKVPVTRKDQANAVFTEVKKTKGLRAAFQAYKAFMQSGN